MANTTLEQRDKLRAAHNKIKNRTDYTPWEIVQYRRLADKLAPSLLDDIEALEEQLLNTQLVLGEKLDE